MRPAAVLGLGCWLLVIAVLVTRVVAAYAPRCLVCGRTFAVFAYLRCRRHRVKP